MPVRKVQGGYQWGKTGKVYPTRAQAERQGRSAYVNSSCNNSLHRILNKIIIK